MKPAAAGAESEVLQLGAQHLQAVQQRNCQMRWGESAAHPAAAQPKLHLRSSRQRRHTTDAAG